MASASQTDTAEIYSPPYLFKGKRPVIKKAPKKADWNESIKVRTAGKPKATSAVLVAPSATTHGNDMNQRLVPLRVKKPKHKKGKRKLKGLQLMTPPSAGVAPPGYYMLFVLDKKGVPSVAKWVQARKLTAAPAARISCSREDHRRGRLSERWFEIASPRSPAGPS